MRNRGRRTSAVVEALDRRLLFAAAPEFVGEPVFAVEADGTASFFADFVDADGAGETHAVGVDWSDGSQSSGLVDEPAGDGTRGTAYGQHTYALPGVYPVTVTITDGTGLSDSTSFLAIYDAGAGDELASGDSSGDLLDPPYGDSPTADFTVQSSSVADTTAPRVQAVFVDSTAWSPAFRTYLADRGHGANGFAVGSGADQSLSSCRGSTSTRCGCSSPSR